MLIKSILKSQLKDKENLNMYQIILDLKYYRKRFEQKL